MWESKLSYQHKWYKHLFHVIIELFYALRPIFKKNLALSRLRLELRLTNFDPDEGYHHNERQSVRCD